MQETKYIRGSTLLELPFLSSRYSGQKSPLLFRTPNARLTYPATRYSVWPFMPHFSLAGSTPGCTSQTLPLKTALSR